MSCSPSSFKWFTLPCQFFMWNLIFFCMLARFWFSSLRRNTVSNIFCYLISDISLILPLLNQPFLFFPPFKSFFQSRNLILLRLQVGNIRKNGVQFMERSGLIWVRKKVGTNSSIVVTEAIGEIMKFLLIFEKRIGDEFEVDGKGMKGGGKNSRLVIGLELFLEPGFSHIWAHERMEQRIIILNINFINERIFLSPPLFRTLSIFFKFSMESSDPNHLYHFLSQSNHPPSKLVKRLYRNNSLNRINANLSLLSSFPCRDSEASTINRSNGNQLVASISLKKFKKSNISERSLEISNGKILITQHHENSQFRNFELLPKKKMFKKLEKLETPSTNKILPDDLIDFPIQNQKVSDLKPLKKMSNISKSGKKKTVLLVQQEHQNLLPEDFIQLLKEDKCITNEFCYLKKMEHPYDLKIIQSDSNFPKNNGGLAKGRNTVPIVYPDQYITISSRGITYFGKEQSRIVPLDEWKKEAEYFKKIMKLNFFKNYKIIKNFGNWKKYIRKSSMKAISEKLKEQLVVNDRFLRTSLLQTRNMCFLMETDVSYCKLDECQNVMNYRDFKQSQEAFIQNEFERKINEIEDDIKSVLIKNMSSSMKEFKEENKISSGNQGKGMPLLIGDEKNLDMPYTKEATLRTQQEKFKKFVKLIDFLIIHSKVNMMNESTDVLAKKINEENDSYERQVIDTKYKQSYKGKQYLECFMTLDLDQESFSLRPTEDQVASLFEEIINRSVVKLCKNHKKISQDMQILSIIYDHSDEFPRESDSSILKVIMTSDDRQQKMVTKLMKEITNSYHYIEQYAEKYANLVQIYFSNTKKLDNIDNFTPRDHEMIKNYMQNWRNQLQKTNQISQDHESALFLLNLKDFKNKATNMTSTCISKIKKVIPRIFEHSIAELTNTLTSALTQMENKPIGVQSYIVFQNNKNVINNDLEDYSDRMLQINCLWILMKTISSNLDSSNMKRQQRQIRQLQTILNNLRRKLEEADMNNKIYETRAQEEVKDMVPKSKSRIVELYNKITALGREERDAGFMVSFIERKSEELKSITAQMLDIRVYQKFLNLEEYSGDDIENFTKFFTTFQQIWETRYAFENYWEKKVMETPWGNINTNDINHRFEQFITNMLALQKSGKNFKKEDFPYQLSNHDMKSITHVVEITQKHKPLVQTIQCLNDKFLTDKEWRQIKLSLQGRKEQNLVSFLEKDKNETTTRELLESSIIHELTFFKGIVYKAKKQNDVVNKLQTIKAFWKSQVNVCRNLLDNFGETYTNLMKQLEQNLILINCIHEDPNERQRIKREKEMLERLREITLLWNEHEKHTSYFDPIYAHLDWKGTKEGKTYSSAEQNWKKTIKQYKDTQLNKLAVNDKLINLLEENNQLFQSLYEHVYTHLNNKRTLYPKLFFLSNKEMIKLYSEHKDFKTLNKALSSNKSHGKIFRHLKQLVIKEDEQIPYEIKNLDGELLPMKIGRVNSFEVQELLKILQESSKSGIKASLKACYQAFDTETFNKTSWISEYPLQSLLYVDKVYFTKIIQYDYLGTGGEDMSRLHAFHLSQIDNLRQIQMEVDSDMMKKKLSILITQSLHTRDVISHLYKNRVQSYESFEWLKQIRHYYNLEQAYIEYLTLPIMYGNEFVSVMDNPIIIHNLNERSLIQFANSIIATSTVPISKKSFAYEFAIYNAKNYSSLALPEGDDTHSLYNFMIGTWLTGTITDIFLSKQFPSKGMVIITKFMKEVKVALSHKQPYLRGSKTLTIQRQSGFMLVPHDNYVAGEMKNLKVDYRELSIPQIGLSQFLMSLFQIWNIKTKKDLAIKLSKIIIYLEETFSICLISRKQLKKVVEETMDFFEPKERQQHLEESIKQKCVAIIEEKVNDQKKLKFMTKILNEEILQGSLLQSVVRKMTNKLIGDRSNHELISKSIIERTKGKRVCIIAGEENRAKELIIQQLYKYQKKEKVGQTKGQYINLKDENLPYLFGFYKSNSHWVEGYLTQLIKKSKNNECFLLKGVVTQKIIQILTKIDQNNFYLQNGEKIEICPSVKFILNGENDYFDFSESVRMCCPIFDADEWTIRYEETFQFILRKYIEESEMNEYQESYTTMSNIFLNNYEKISSNLKLIGFKNEFMENQFIMERFVKIIKAALLRDQDKCCLKNLKMFQKLYFWSIYWAISSGIPKINSSRFDKILFESVKTDMDRSQKLSQTHFVVSQRMQTVCKSIKEDVFLQNQGKIIKVLKEVQAKAEYIHLLTEINNPIMIIGEKGGGKSTFLSYLKYKFSQERPNPFTFLNISMHGKMKMNEFMSQLFIKSFIRLKSVGKTYQLSPLNGNKLIVFIDNINLIDRQNGELIDFFQTAFSFGYYFDKKSNSKIFLDNICFICAENSSFQSLDWYFLLLNCVPIYIDQIDLKELVDEYKDAILIEKGQKEQIYQKLSHALQSTASIHNFVVNLIQPSNQMEKYHLSNCSAVWIVLDLIHQAGKVKSFTELISNWKYICIQKYINAGIPSIEREQSEQILNQINNLTNLMLKNKDDVDNIFLEEKQFFKNLQTEFPLLKINDCQNYYIYLMYVMKASNSRHILKAHEKIHPNLKEKVLQKISKRIGKEFVKLTSIIQITPITYSLKDKIVYVPANSSPELLETCLIHLTNENIDLDHLSFVIDLSSSQKLLHIISKYPSIPDSIQIYKDESLYFYEKSCGQKYEELIRFIEEQTLPQGINHDDLLMQICYKLPFVQKKMGQKIKRRLEVLERVKKNFSQLDESIERTKCEIKKRKVDIQEMTLEEEKMMNEKNSLVKELKELKKEQNESQKSKQTLNKNISHIDSELQKVKRKKNMVMEELAKKIQIKQEGQSMQQILQYLNKQYQNKFKSCSIIQLHTPSIIFTTVLLLIYYRKKEKYSFLISFIEKIMENVRLNLEKVFTATFNIQINDIKNQTFILWAFYDKSVTFFVQNSEKQFLISQIIEKCSEVKHCSNTYEINEFGGKFPIITSQNLSTQFEEASEIKSIEFLTYLEESKEVFYKYCPKKNEEFCQKIYERIDSVRTNEIEFAEKEMKKYSFEKNIMEGKIRSRLESHSNPFSSKNQTAEVKQFYEASKSLQERQMSLKTKIQQIKNEQKEEIGKLVNFISWIYRYLLNIKELYPYAKITNETYSGLVMKSLVYYSKEKEEAKENEEKQQIEESSQILDISSTKLKLLKSCFYWVSIILKNEDSLTAYFLLGCFVQESKGLLSLRKIQIMEEIIIKGNGDRIKELIEEGDLKIIKNHSPQSQITFPQNIDDFEKILCFYCFKNMNKYPFILNYSERVLGFNFKHEILLNKIDIISSILEISDFQHKQQQIIVGLGSQYFNSLKVVDKELHKVKSQEETILTFTQNDHLSFVLDLLEKLTPNQQFWIILWNWYNSYSINAIINYINSKTSTTSLNLFLLFDSTQKYLQISNHLKINNFLQISLSSKENNVCFSFQKILTKLIPKNSPPQQAKLLKMLYFDKISLVLKSLLENKELRFISYYYQFFQMLLKKYPKMDLNSLFSFALDFMYENGEKIFPREVKKILKINKLSQFYEDNYPVEVYSLVNESCEEIKRKLQHEQNFKQFVSQIIPKTKLKKFYSDILYQFQNKMQKQNSDKKPINLTKSQYLSEIEDLLNKIPVLNKQEKAVKNGSQYLYKNILKDERNNLERIFKKKVQIIKKAKKLLINDQTISYKSMNLLQGIVQLNKDGKSVKDFFIETQKNIQLLDNLIERKEHFKNIDFDLLTSPKSFLHSYIFQISNQSIDWTNIQLVCRCFSEKQKENFLQNQDKKEYLCLGNIFVENGKFDSHRAIIENTFEDGSINKEKMNNNIFVYLRKEEGFNTSFRRFELIKNQKEIIGVYVSSKIKEPNIWDKAVCLFQQKQ